MKKLNFTLILAAVILLSATACKKKPQSGHSTFKFDQVFELKMGGSSQLEGGDLKITFTEVSEDSRCPKGVDCFQEGRIRILLTVVSGSQSRTLEFARQASQTDNVTQSFENYKIQWLGVTPYPERDKKIKPEDYKLNLAVRQVK